MQWHVGDAPIRSGTPVQYSPAASNGGIPSAGLDTSRSVLTPAPSPARAAGSYHVAMRSSRLPNDFQWRTAEDGRLELHACWERRPVAQAQLLPTGRWRATVYTHLDSGRQRSAEARTEQKARYWLERWAAAFVRWVGTRRYTPSRSGSYPWADPADVPLGPTPEQVSAEYRRRKGRRTRWWEPHSEA